MLLVDGQPYSLSKEDYNLHSKKIIVMVPLSKVRRNPDMGNRIEPSAGQGITTIYTTTIGEKSCTVRWYENSRYDDVQRTNVYSPDLIMIPDTGFIEVVNNPELSWFLKNHTAWAENPLRKSVNGRQPLIPVSTMIQFRILNVNSGNDQVFKKIECLNKMSAMVQDAKWDELQGMAEVLASANSASIPMPYQVMFRRDLSKDEIEALRSAILEVIMKEPIFVHDKIMNDKQADIAAAINNLSFGDNPSLTFDGANRTWLLNEGKKEATKLYSVPTKDDPQTFLIKKATEDKEIGAKLLKMSKAQAVSA